MSMHDHAEHRRSSAAQLPDIARRSCSASDFSSLVARFCLPSTAPTSLES